MGHHGNSFLSFGVAPVGEVGGWIELGRTTLGSTGSSIDVTGLSDKRYLMVLTDARPDGANINMHGQINNDTASNYAYRSSIQGAADGTTASTTSYQTIQTGGNQYQCFGVTYLAKLSAQEKLIQNWGVPANTAGAGNAPLRTESVAKWVNTSNVIDEINMINLGGGSALITGSEVVVLGWDPADTHSSNFWEVLADVDLSTGEADLISSGTITAKKYPWIQYYIEASGNVVDRVTFNNTSGNEYAVRRSLNGAADTTFTNQAFFEGGQTTTSTSFFVNMFIINNSANEKLIIAHSVNQNTAGAGTAPNRNEGAYKWDSTSAQITEIDIDNGSSGDFGKDSFLKVWGSN